LVAAAKFLVAATKNLFVVPNFVALPKPFFSVSRQDLLSVRLETLTVVRKFSFEVLRGDLNAGQMISILVTYILSLEKQESTIVKRSAGYPTQHNGSYLNLRGFMLLIFIM